MELLKTTDKDQLVQQQKTAPLLFLSQLSLIFVTPSNCFTQTLLAAFKNNAPTLVVLILVAYNSSILLVFELQQHGKLLLFLFISYFKFCFLIAFLRSF